MPPIPGYEREPYRTELETEVLECGEAEGRPFALLADTILYPEGGGQPADRGLLGGVPVLDVQHAEGSIRHYLEEPVPVGPATLQLDWRRRFDHMQQHTAQHLLTAVVARRHGWETTSFHLGEEICDIELEAPPDAALDLEELEEAAMVEVRADRAVRARRVSPAEYARLEARSRGLPASHRGDVRLVEIEGLDLTTCGGTHLGSSAEIEAIELLASEPKRGGQRLVWIAGGRVRRRLREREAQAAELRRLLETSDRELAEVAAVRLERLKEAERRGRLLERRLAEAVAERLAGESAELVEAHLEDCAAGPLRQAAAALASRAPAKSALLTSSGPEGAFFLVASGPDSPLDAAAAGRRVAELLEGRGGGSGGIYQGKAGSLAGRAGALAAIAEMLASRS